MNLSIDESDFIITEYPRRIFSQSELDHADAFIRGWILLSLHRRYPDELARQYAETYGEWEEDYGEEENYDGIRVGAVKLFPPMEIVNLAHKIYDEFKGIK